MNKSRINKINIFNWTRACQQTCQKTMSKTDEKTKEFDQLKEEVRKMVGFVPNSLLEMCKSKITSRVYLDGVRTKKE